MEQITAQIMTEMKVILKAGFEDMKAKMRAHEERMMSITKAGLEEIQSGAGHREVPKKGAAAKSSGALKKRHRGRI
jgi:hypothetical protein